MQCRFFRNCVRLAECFKIPNQILLILIINHYIIINKVSDDYLVNFEFSGNFLRKRDAQFEERSINVSNKTWSI